MVIDADTFCTDVYEVFQFIGYIVLVLKIIIPTILIVLGVIALGKAVIAADDKEIKTAANSFIKKFITAVVIFFIPSIVKALFGFVGNFASVDYKTCINCITDPKNCKGTP